MSAICGLSAAYANANNLLTNSFEFTGGEVPGWELQEFATDTALGTVNSAALAGFASQTGDPEDSGLWLQSFRGLFIGDGDEGTNAILTQTVPGSPGETYTFSGYSSWEQNYSGGVAFLDLLSPLGEIPSPTETLFEIEFLGSGGSVLQTETLDLRTEQFNGAGWTQHSVSGVAPAGTTDIRVSAKALDMVPNLDPGQSAFADDFSLTAGGAPGVEILTNAGLDDSQPNVPFGWEISGDDNAGRTEGFAAFNSAIGYWVAPRGADIEPQDAVLAQIVDASPGDTYTFSGRSFFEPAYPGGVETLNTLGAWGAIPSDTETLFKLDFLDDGGAVLGSEMLDLRTVQTNDGTWREHELTGTAPAGTAELRVAVEATSLRSNREPGGAFDDAYFDDFFLSLATASVDGDFDGDGRVDNTDLNLLLNNWGQSEVSPEWISGLNGAVDNEELNLLLNGWGTGTSVAVPEPTALALAALLGLGVAVRRR
ncbi:MAG: hypothetical protein AAFV43_16490 [Planctomycetota bacterium]